MKLTYLFCSCVEANNLVWLISKFVDEPTCDKQIGACQIVSAQNDTMCRHEQNYQNRDRLF